MSDDFRDVRPDGRTTGFTLRWVLWAFFIVIVIGGIGAAVRFAGGWASQPAQIFSAENVREQWRFAYEYDESLRSAARQVCTAEEAVQNAVDDDTRTQRETQRIALTNNYNRIAAEYNGRLRNAFEAGWVRPRDVPERAPELQVLKNEICPRAP